MLAENDLLTVVNEDLGPIVTALAAECNSLRMDAALFPPDLPLLVVQADSDGTSDPEGSEYLLSHSSSNDKTKMFLDYGWHYLSKEPGFLLTIQKILGWMKAKGHHTFKEYDPDSALTVTTVRKSAVESPLSASSPPNNAKSGEGPGVQETEDQEKRLEDTNKSGSLSPVT